MLAGINSNHTAARLPQLAAAAIIFWLLGTNTQIGVTNTSRVHNAKPLAVDALAAPRNIQVLSPRDASLYRAAFAAQAENNWTEADRILLGLHDRGLLGHVLADRYQRRAASAQELQTWLSSYSGLPEAPELFRQAQRLADAKGLKLSLPSTGDIWAGSDASDLNAGPRMYSRVAVYDVKPEPAPAPAQVKGKGTKAAKTAAKNAVKAAATAKTVAVRLDHAIRKGDLLAAKTLVEAEQKHHTLKADALTDAQARLAAAYYYDGGIDDAKKLATEAALRQHPLGLWITGLVAYRQDKSALAGMAFSKLASQPALSGRERAAAAFWAWRMLKKNGDDDDAREWLKQAADQPQSFYGVLAGSLLRQEDRRSWQLPAFDNRNLSILAATPAGWRALALLQAGKPDLAEAELVRLNPHGRPDLQRAMLSLADAAHLPSLALRIGTVAVNDNGKPYDAALYPVPPWQPVKGFKVDRALIFALMRHESHFEPAAMSGAGACGLMQLMPATAKLVASFSDGDSGNSRSECPDSLLDPAINIALGQGYVQRLAGEPMIGDNLLLLLAAYNGGPARMAHWIDEDTKKDPLLFIESLPVRETHDYVQQVLVHYWMYRERLGLSTASLNALARGDWPHVTLHDQMPLLPKIREAHSDGFEVASANAR